MEKATKMKDKHKLISLFSGGMGLDLGLEQAGFETVVANEIDKSSIQTIQHNRPDLPLITKSIVQVSGSELLRAGGLRKGSFGLVAGGPPCQSFSVFGNRKGTSDLRGQMVYEFIRVVEETKPRVFIMENVRGILSMKTNGGEFCSEIILEYLSGQRII